MVAFSDVTKIKIRHADPALILRLLNGTVDPWLQPEFSTLVNLGSFVLGGGAGGNGRRSK